MEQFEKDIIEGLTSEPKYISSKYFYDEIGDSLFQRIMLLPEYYLTLSEYDIFENYKNELHDVFLSNSRGFNLIEFGAGDAYKTKVLLNSFTEKGTDFIYSPVDISGNVLDILEKNLKSEIPKLSIDSVESEYFDALDIITKRNCDKKVVLFLGSNIGNFSEQQIIDFLSSVREKLSQNDLFVIGFDLRKDPLTILNAYNDKQGVTSDFNINLLARINKELHADFDLDNFYHYPLYDPTSGIAKSYLVSKKWQKVHLRKIEASFVFEKDEAIFTESSKKFTLDEINYFASKSGFEIFNNYFDSNYYFVDSVWGVKE